MVKTVGDGGRVKYLACLLVGVSLALVSGCDQQPATVPVSGQVLIDGKPLTFGTVMFIQSGTRPAMGTLDSEGRFQLSCFEPGDGAVPGRYRVKVTAVESIDDRTVRWHAPKKYANQNTSGIGEIEITEPTDDLVIELTWDGGKPFIERH